MNLEELCENIDASVFSGDLLWQTYNRNKLKQYCERWQRAIAEHEEWIKNNPNWESEE
jgi:hypothetical protein